MICGLLPIALTACTGASHIPGPWEIPGSVIGTTIGNARYEAKRDKVKAYLTLYYDIILTELSGGRGEHIFALYEHADVPREKFSIITQEFVSNPNIYQNGSSGENIEKMTITIMVHSQ